MFRATNPTPVPPRPGALTEFDARIIARDWRSKSIWIGGLFHRKKIAMPVFWDCITTGVKFNAVVETDV
jgi:hypothetical protein